MAREEKNRIGPQGPATQQADRRSANTTALANAKSTDGRTAAATTSTVTIDKAAFIASVMNDAGRYQYYLRIAAKIVGEQDAPDIVQNAYVKALSTTTVLDGTKNTNAWFARVVSSAAFDEGRKRKRRGENSLDEMSETGALDTLEGLSETPNLAQGIEAAERSLIIQRAIEAANLSEIKQILLQGRYGEDDKSYETLAAECNTKGFTKPDGSEIDANYVKSLLNRGRGEVKKQLLAAGIDSKEETQS